ncbi:MAG: flagellar hook-associated protein FlgK [Verrucomicrobiota bacterium]
MLGLFGTLNLATTSLQTQMAGVEVAGNNLANVNTPGYSRQRVVIQNNISIPVSAGMEGTGASVQAIQQIVDNLLNGQIQTQSSQTGYWNAQQSALQNVQTALNEYLNSGDGADTGLSSKLSAFFKALSAVATTPNATGNETRQGLIGAAQTLATAFQQINSRTLDLRNALDNSLTSQVSEANQLITSIASLNDQIANAETFTNGVANDLRDLRQQKLEELSKYFNYQTDTNADGTVTLTWAGQTFVDGNQTPNKLTTAVDTNTGMLQVWTTGNNNLMTGVPFGFSGGSLAGTANARDGGLADLRNSINTLATNLIAEFNAVHATGFNLAGGSGNAFFTGTNASDIAVNQAIATDPTLIQASGVAGNPGDGSVALSLSRLASSSFAALSNQTFSSYYGQAVGQLGTELSNANDQVDSQTSVAAMLANQRSAVSGVNLDEEMTSLMMYQRAYQASAHVVSTVDQMIQVLLGMGAG